MRFTKVFAIGSLVLLGCNPSDFNTILDKAPVQELSTEGSSTGSLFVLPLPAEQTSNIAARMLVSRKDSSYLAVANYDKTGKVTQYRAEDVEAVLGSPVHSSARRADGSIIVGTPSFGGGQTPVGKVTTLAFSSKPDGSPSFGILSYLQGGSRLGISVAAGSITGAATGDFVAVSDDSVRLIGTDQAMPEIASSATDGSCPILQMGSATEFYAFRPVVVADLLTGANEEIVLGGQVAGQGRVLFVQYNGTPVLPCPTRALTLGTSISFGTSLAVGDFDGDGRKDLAVGAPPNHVYVYFGPLDTATTWDVDIEGATPTQFGKQIAAYTMQGQASAQLMVADPTAQSKGGVGQVMIFNVSRGTSSIKSSEAVAILFDSNTDSDPGLFGLNLGGVEFNTELCNPGGGLQLIPWVSLGPKLFTFFAYGGSPADPRCFN
jgi:hypothetical protein